MEVFMRPHAEPSPSGLAYSRRPRVVSPSTRHHTPARGEAALPSASPGSTTSSSPSSSPVQSPTRRPLNSTRRQLDFSRSPSAAGMTASTKRPILGSTWRTNVPAEGSDGGLDSDFDEDEDLANMSRSFEGFTFSDPSSSCSPPPIHVLSDFSSPVFMTSPASAADLQQQTCVNSPGGGGGSKQRPTRGFQPTPFVLPSPFASRTLASASPLPSTSSSTLNRPAGIGSPAVLRPSLFRRPPYDSSSSSLSSASTMRDLDSPRDCFTFPSSRSADLDAASSSHHDHARRPQLTGASPTTLALPSVHTPRSQTSSLHRSTPASSSLLPSSTPAGRPLSISTSSLPRPQAVSRLLGGSAPARGRQSLDPAILLTSTSAPSSTHEYEDARPSPGAFEVSLMKKSSSRGSLSSSKSSRRASFVSPPTPNTKAPPPRLDFGSPWPSPGSQHARVSSYFPTSSSGSGNGGGATSPTRSGFLSSSSAIPRLAKPTPLAAQVSSGSTASTSSTLSAGSSRTTTHFRPTRLFGSPSTSANAGGDFSTSSVSQSKGKGHHTGLKRKGSSVDASQFSTSLFSKTTPSPTSRRRATAQDHHHHHHGSSGGNNGAGSPIPVRQVKRPLLMRTSAGEDRFARDFAVVGELGKGETGVVWEVTERATGRRGAVKVGAIYAGSKDRIRHLEELDILRLISRPDNLHPNLLLLRSAWEQSARLHLHVPIYSGDLRSFLESFDDLAPGLPSLNQSEGLDEGRVWKLVASLSSALARLHGLGVIHLDIKPANVLVDTEGEVCLADFGHATRWPRVGAREILQGAEADAGTMDLGWEGQAMEWDREGDRDYLSAEGVRGVISPKGDIFSFGLTVLEALTDIVPPSLGEPYHRLRSDDFSDLEAPRLAPSPLPTTSRLLNSPSSAFSDGDAFPTCSTAPSTPFCNFPTPTGGETALDAPFNAAVASWGSPQIVALVKAMMSSDPSCRPSAREIFEHPVVQRANQAMVSGLAGPTLAPEPVGFLESILEGSANACGVPTHFPSLPLLYAPARMADSMDVDRLDW